MSKKKPTVAPAPTGGRVIDLNALLGNWPTIRVGATEFVGRELNATEAAQWRELEQQDDAEGQYAWLAATLTARGATLTVDQIKEQPRSYWVAVVQGLYTGAWPGGGEGEAKPR